MGIDYRAVSGWGIEIDYADCRKLGWDEDSDESSSGFLDNFEDKLKNIRLENSGSYYSGYIQHWFLIEEEDTLQGTVRKVPEFIEELKELGILIEEKDIVRVSKLLQY